MAPRYCPWPRFAWTTQSPHFEVVQNLAFSLKIPRILAQCMALRGVETVEQAQDFLHPRLSNACLPSAFPGVTACAQKIHQAIEAQQPIVIFGDYDADGMMASIVLYNALKALGASPTVFIPNRETEGYGFTQAALQRCIQEHPETHLIITVDCGISQIPTWELASQMGLEVIITDHHAVLAEVPPQSHATCVYTQHPQTPPALQNLCGTGVAFKIAHELAREFLPPETGRSLLQQLLPLVAIATLADLVPLTLENRILTAKGLQEFASTKPTLNPGIQAIKRVTKIYHDVTAQRITFSIVPRINASGRVGSPQTVFNLFTTQDPASALELAQTLEQNNVYRRQIEADAVQQAIELIQQNPTQHQHAIILLNQSWHPGVVGLIASHIVEKYQKPTVILTQDEQNRLRGSARAPDHPNSNLMVPLAECSHLLTQFGGHRIAAGLGLEFQHLEAFQIAFSAACERAFSSVSLQSSLAIDAWLMPFEITEKLVESILSLEPCGAANPEPIFALHGVTLRSNPVCFGRTTKDNWDLTFCEFPWNALLFKTPKLSLRKGARLDLVFTLSRDHHGEPQLLIKDLNPLSKD